MARAAAISFKGFCTRYSSENSCWEEMFRQRFPQGFVCPKCGCTEYSFIRTRKACQCRSCGSVDIAVCGGGIAGVCAAVTAARHGAQVILIESGGCLGALPLGLWRPGHRPAPSCQYGRYGSGFP